MLSLAGPAPAKRRRLLVLSTSKKGKVQPTADQTKSIPAAKGPAADEPMQLTKFPPVDQPPMSGGGSQEVKQHSKIEAKGQRSAPGTPALAAGRCTVMVHIKSVVGTKPLLTTGTAVLSETAGQSQREQRRQGASQRTSHQSASRDVIQEERAKAMPTHFPFKASKQRPGASDDNNSQAAGVGSSASIACKQPEAATAASTPCASLVTGGNGALPEAGCMPRPAPGALLAPCKPTPADDSTNSFRPSTEGKTVPESGSESQQGQFSVKPLPASLPDDVSNITDQGQAVPSEVVKMSSTSPEKECNAAAASGQPLCATPPEKQSTAAASGQPLCATPPRCSADTTTKSPVRQPETLLMVRRLPAILTGSLPTAESLGLQLSMPGKADMLSESICLLADIYLPFHSRTSSVQPNIG